MIHPDESGQCIEPSESLTASSLSVTSRRWSFCPDIPLKAFDLEYNLGLVRATVSVFLQS
jgi:hypothetical protein